MNAPQDFAGEFAGGSPGDRSVEIAQLENRAADVASAEIAGGPSGVPVMGKGKTLKISPSSETWIRIVVQQPKGNRSIFLNVYEDDGETWMQSQSGFAHQQEEQYSLEIFLTPRDKPYLVVAASTLDNYGNEFSIDIESPVELAVEEVTN